MQAQGSVLTNKYAEGYPGKRYYGGCEFVDVAENLARERVKQLFGCDHANVQPHSGTSANIAAYLAVLDHGDTILGMSLADGGHLTHGSEFNVSGKRYIDGSSGAMVSNIGHSNPAVLQAMREQMEKSTFGYRLHFRTTASEELAARTAAKMPPV